MPNKGESRDMNTVGEIFLNKLKTHVALTPSFSHNFVIEELFTSE